MNKRLTPRVTLVIIAAMFVLPLAAAWLMYTGAIDYKPASTRNLGQLVEPPVPLSWRPAEILPVAGETATEAEQDLLKHWVVLKALPADCSEPCLQSVTELRQVHRTTGRNQERVRIALLLQDPVPASTLGRLRETYPEFRLFLDREGVIGAAMATAAPADAATYLVDPLGNIMMTYANGTDPNYLKKDLKRLLTWSKLDE